MLREPPLIKGARPPRWLSALLFALIGLAAVLALLWPRLAAQGSPVLSGPAAVGIITRELPLPGAAGRIGAPAPDFGWVDPSGAQRSLGALRGRTVVINFWATWCVPCREEMPALERVAVARPDAEFLEVDLQEDVSSVRAFFDRLGLRALEPLLDGDGAITRAYGVVSLPTTYFIDAGGVIAHIEIGGPMDDEKIRNGIERATRP